MTKRGKKLDLSAYEMAVTKEIDQEKNLCSLHESGGGWGRGLENIG